MKRLREKLSYANVMATIAVFLVLGGGAAVAAGGLAKNSVGAKQLKANAVTTAKIKNGAVTGGKIKASTLGNVPSATNATNAGTASNANALGGVAAGGYQRTALWALVEADGTIIEQSGGISLQGHTSGSGAYYLHFPQPVVGKGISLTAWEGWEPIDPAFEVAPCGGAASPGSVSCGSGTNTTSDLFVGTQEEAGNYEEVAFYVVVLP